MDKKRPTLNDPSEFALIKSIYFKEIPRFDNELDVIEHLERMSKSNKNQAR